MRHSYIIGAALLALLPVSPLQAQDNDFTWQQALASGKTIEIKGVNGDVHAVRATGAEVRVTATKSGRKSDPETVTIEVIEHAGGVTVCAVYPTQRGREPNECGPGGEGRMNTQRNDVKVDFTVHVPAGVNLYAKTVNGEISAERLASNIEARTVNGEITLATTGFASAMTVNGSIVAKLGSSTWPDDIEFKTVNGGITLDVPAALNTDIRISTLNGSIETDFPITVTGQISRRSMRGTIGTGGRDLYASTVNGSIKLRSES